MMLLRIAPNVGAKVVANNPLAAVTIFANVVILLLSGNR